MPKLSFLNVDLDMIFAKEPKVLLRELDRKVSMNYAGEHPKGYLVALELKFGSYENDPHKAPRGWFRLLKALSPPAMQQFQKASSRVFDLGFEVSSESRSVQVELPKEYLAEMAKLGASYVVTLYAAEPERLVVIGRKGSYL